MFLGIDLGTSGLKVILLDRDHQVRASATAPLAVQQQQPLWREQDPAAWWRACEDALDAVLARAVQAGISPGAIEAIGLTGQMHGATCLGAQGDVLRPAILWNDGRAHAECLELEARVADSRSITGNLMMPGFTAPKLLWLARHEPRVFERIAKVLLPKDYLRWQLTGDFASDLSDAAGTLWLDVGRRDWSDELLAATSLARAQMPRLHEGTEITGRLRADVAKRFGLDTIPVVAGASDNAAGALGVGVVRAGQAMLSLGTSGVCFVATDGFVANPAQAVHSFCHALPHTWHLMSVMLSAASCLDFTARLTGATDISALLHEAQQQGLREDTPLFLPYLNGERTPHNNPAAQAVFFGMHAGTLRADLVNATLEGVGLGLAQGIAALEAAGARMDSISLIGGGARSAYWAQMLADISGKTLLRRAEAEVGPSLGAARLAWMACDSATAAQVCTEPALVQAHEPVAARRQWHSARGERFAQLYRQVEPSFPAPA
ncbi:MAG: xylulokinase [Comamonadaceae bacterium]|nr:MAG: xylulokinase [Comamonadaceae bacterium]